MGSGKFWVYPEIKRLQRKGIGKGVSQKERYPLSIW